MRANIKDPKYLKPCEYREPEVDLNRIFTCGDDFGVMENLRVGDVAYCMHGNIWVIDYIYRYSGIAVAKNLSPSLNPIRHRKAVNALAHAETPEIVFGLAAEAKYFSRKAIVESEED